MKKRLFAWMILATVSIFTTRAQEDPVAEQYLDAVAEKTHSIEPFRLTFTFTTINLQDNSESSYKGSLVLYGKKYLLKTEDSEIIFDGQTLWNYLPDADEVNITNPDPEDHSFFTDPGQLFTNFKQRFKYHYVDKQTVGGKSLLVIDLYPVDLAESYSRIRLQVDEKQMVLHSAHYFGKNGTHYILRIEKTEPNIKVSPGYFTFNPADHPDTEIIDLRDM
ncbi:MAG: outer membrane lipoprotein carrier protein LolA [Chlorobi bacterium]|nr:outer membrane lipoprotein carrier protein LolA [Chlorobiota bacterium]